MFLKIPLEILLQICEYKIKKEMTKKKKKRMMMMMTRRRIRKKATTRTTRTATTTMKRLKIWMTQKLFPFLILLIFLYTRRSYATNISIALLLSGSMLVVILIHY